MEDEPIEMGAEFNCSLATLYRIHKLIMNVQLELIENKEISNYFDCLMILIPEIKPFLSKDESDNIDVLLFSKLRSRKEAYILLSLIIKYGHEKGFLFKKSGDMGSILRR